MLSRWIDEGATYEAHWAFQQVQRPTPPAVVLSGWPRNDIDRFVLARLEAGGWTPSPQASLPVLLRRMSFDLTGLPPTPAQLAAWQAADDPVENALNELLASPHYGERMAADWLDVARYADTHGFNNDAARTAWRWRDWVVDAFNANLPYDRFITAQLAGDLLPDAALEDHVATAFNRNHVINSEGGIIDEEYRVEYVADRVRTMSLAWLGLTMECGRCHDQKFDPITQREYYQLFAFFNNVDETGEDGRVDNAAPLMRAPTREQQRRYEQLQADEQKLLDDLRRQFTQRPPAPQGGSTSGSEPTTPGANATPDEQQLPVAMEAAPAPIELSAATPLAAEAKPVELQAGWALVAWAKRAGEQAAPLLSTQNFAVPASSQGYGEGLHIGFTEDGAVEVRIAVRWPGYALSVRSADKAPKGQWRHVAVVGQGTKAAGIRIFLDGIESETDVRHDDLTGGVTVSGRLQLGAARSPSENHFAGHVSRVRLLAGALDPPQFEALLTREVLDHAPAAGDEVLAWERQLLSAMAERSSADAAFTRTAAAWKAARSERLAYMRTFPTLMIMRELASPRQTFVLERGQYDKPTEPVVPDVPSALGLPLPADLPRNRIALARWLTDPRHPLTARVVVNRLWHSVFGVGLVKTVEDFGSQGEYPSHPELLDWLAAEFIESGWNIQRVLRLIVESATYQQDSAAAPQQWAQDPENRLLARGPRQRLAAEMIRDQALAASGLLVPKLGGPPVFPYQPADLYQGIVVAANYPGTTYTVSQGEGLYRRSLYTFWKRTVPHPTLTTFDALDREFCAARRLVTNTPQQALALMNDPTFLEAARQLGQRMLDEGGPTDASRLSWAFKLLTARPPEPFELATLLRLLSDHRAEFATEPPPGILAAGASPPSDAHDRATLAAYASVASLLLNLDEVITKN